MFRRSLFGVWLAGVVALPAVARPLALGEERVPAGEAAATKQIVQMIELGVRKEFETTGFAHRDAHAKHHGCVNATFVVEPTLAKLHPDLAVGVFAGKQYPAWIRMSNGQGKIQSDKIGDGRGMAIKLMDVPGDKLMADEQKTQDFLMINHPVFFVRNAVDYVEFTKAAGAGRPQDFFFKLWPPTLRLHEGKIAKAVQAKVVLNPFETPYWSMTPVMNGKQAIKYMAAPCKGQTFLHVPEDDHQLRLAMKKQIDAGDVCYEFLVQTQTDARRMPIEDPTIEWSTRRSPYVKVAEIHIPHATNVGFTTKASLDFCEDLSYSPWHSVSEHRPVGGIQRVRRTVYETISRVRHELNHRPAVEPRP